MNARRAPLALVVACGLWLVPHALPAQEIGAAYQFVHSHHYLVRGLHGGSIEVTSRRVANFAAVRLSLSHAMGGHYRRGNSCFGLIWPNDSCADEPIRSTAQLTSGGIALDLRFLDTAPVDASLIIAAHRVRVDSRSRGLVSGREHNGGQAPFSPGIGAQVTWFGNSSFPLGVRGTLEYAHHRTSGRVIVDGYEPLSEGFDTGRFAIGVVYRLKRQR